MKNLEALKKKIQEACPDLMDLKFGCAIKTTRNEIVWLINKGHNSDYGEDFWTYSDSSYLVCTNENSGEPDEIIGSPITLSHVLRTIEDKIKDKYRITSTGIIEHYNSLIGRHIVDGEWNLENDNLDLQSQETVDFLAELLGATETI